MKGRRSTLGPGREFDLIRSALASAPSVSDRVSVGPGDDAAVFSARAPVVISSDLTVEGVHFKSEWLSPQEVGYRATAAALSDLAAMAARPIGVLLSVGVDADRSTRWIPDISAGAAAVLDHTGGSMLGGDTTRVPDGAPVVVDVVAVGESESAVERSGAGPGEEIWVTGELGLAALAVQEWYAGRQPEADARSRFVRPTPRIHEASWLAERVELTSMIDLSDGLAADAGHLAAASGVRIDMDASLIPISETLLRVRGTDAPRVAATGGEDYELCFTAPKDALVGWRSEFEHHFGIRLTRVGVVTSGTGVGIVGLDLTQLEAGHDHFQTERPA